jgi:hypothetical protein
MTGSIGRVLLLGGQDGRAFTMNPRLVEPGFVAACYARTSPLVPVRTRTATTTRSDSGDIWKNDDTWRRGREASAREVGAGEALLPKPAANGELGPRCDLGCHSLRSDWPQST